jgi:predicted DNA-binding protein (UPF0251 family)
MDDSKTPQAVVSGPKLPLSAVARAVTRFWFGQAQLPTSLSFYGGFFTGFFTAAAVAPALFAYMDRHKSDPSKIQLVVFHVVRLFEQRPDYWRLSANPRMLLAKMEPEVMRLVDLHISKTDAGKVMEELKRKFDSGKIQEKARKRMVARHQEERVLIPAPMPGTFPPASPTTPKKVSAAPSPFSRSSAPSPKPEPEPRLQHAPKSVSYGLDYNDRALYSSPFSSPSSSSREPSPSRTTTSRACEAAATTVATKLAPKKSPFKKGRGRGRTGGVPYAQVIWKEATLSPVDESKLPPPVNRVPAYAIKRNMAEAERAWKRR